MRLSVAYTFEPGLIERLAAFPEVTEVYGKLDRDVVGGGRSTYTLRPTSRHGLRKAVDEAHRHSIAFNYLINAANLDGSEQTRSGQRTLRRFLAWIDDQGVDAVTLASPLLLRIVKKEHPRLKVRVGVFAVVDSVAKARQWESMGADTICLSGIACNRDFDTLGAIRRSTVCDLQLIVNANCVPDCAHELTHMNLLTQSSRSGHKLKGYCLDYCFLHCSLSRLSSPELYLQSPWIRPEDLSKYEAMGFSNFKIVERSCPADLLIKRVQAYVNRSFEGNLMELIAPVAQIKKELKPTTRQYMRMLLTLARPWHAKVSRMLLMKEYAESAMISDFSKAHAGVFIDNKSLNGYLEACLASGCRNRNCDACAVCKTWAENVVQINSEYQAKVVETGRMLEAGLADGSHWF